MYRILLCVIFTLIFSVLRYFIGFESTVISILSVILINTMLGDE